MSLHKECSHRRGAVLIVALVCMLVMMSIVGGMLQGAILARRQLHEQRDLRQAEAILEAGADRAFLRLEKDPLYAGETMMFSAVEIVGSGRAEVSIEVVPAASDEPKHLRVVVEYPTGQVHSIRKTRRFPVEAKKL